MIRLTLTPQSRKEFERFLDLADELGNPGADAVRPLQEGIRAGFEMNFASEGRQGGEPWAALAERTQRERERLGYPAEHPILVRSGSYRDSFTDEGHPNHISDWSADGGRWLIEEGSSDERVEELEYGRWDMPARPVTILGEAGEARLSEIARFLFDQWFED